LGGLFGNGTKCTVPDPEQGNSSDVGIGFSTPYFLNVTVLAAGVAGAGA
jgi:hypothetical protein